MILIFAPIVKICLQKLKKGQSTSRGIMTYFGPSRTANHGRYMFLPGTGTFTGKSILIHSTIFYYTMTSPWHAFR